MTAPASDPVAGASIRIYHRSERDANYIRVTNYLKSMKIGYVDEEWDRLATQYLAILKGFEFDADIEQLCGYPNSYGLGILVDKLSDPTEDPSPATIVLVLTPDGEYDQIIEDFSDESLMRLGEMFA